MSSFLISQSCDFREGFTNLPFHKLKARFPNEPNAARKVFPNNCGNGSWISLRICRSRQIHELRSSDSVRILGLSSLTISRRSFRTGRITPRQKTVGLIGPAGLATTGFPTKNRFKSSDSSLADWYRSLGRLAKQRPTMALRSRETLGLS